MCRSNQFIRFQLNIYLTTILTEHTLMSWLRSIKHNSQVYTKASLTFILICVTWKQLWFSVDRITLAFLFPFSVRKPAGTNEALRGSTLHSFLSNQYRWPKKKSSTIPLHRDSYSFKAHSCFKRHHYSPQHFGDLSVKHSIKIPISTPNKTKIVPSPVVGSVSMFSGPDFSSLLFTSHACRWSWMGLPNLHEQ